MVRENDPAPEFTLPAEDGRPVSLAALRGQNVVLYFYPRDDTPGCTVEACEFRDLLPRFRGLNATVFGVSPDDADSHRAFKEKFALPFSLLADTEHAVADAYGVWKEKAMFGNKYWGNERTTFIIGRDGRVAKVFAKVKPEGHAEDVARAVAALG
ncbi:MAG TPA: thioredoxin-dependent thiol peroxidase [Gemmatimonadaceae bacterium]|nr:thioredoxin-dependent thiol peroxidase [Gemmatimonadaceae bacterium]